MSENQRTTNEAILASGTRTVVNIANGTIFNVAGGNVNNPVQSAAATTGQASESQNRLRIDGLEKNFDSHTKTRSTFKITGKFPTLREPISEFSPQMTKTANYFGGGRAEAISHEEFLQEITQGKSKRIVLIGSAGFGKTVALKKLAQKLLKNKHRNHNLPNEQRFKLIHWIDMKSLQDEDTTLQEVLFDDLDLNQSDMEYLLHWIKHNQSQVIFLFDGLDETRFDSSLSHDRIRGLSKKRSVGHLMHNLLSRNFFPEVKVVITSREYSVTMLPEEARPKLVIALTGFTQNDAEKLFCEVSGETDDQSIHNIRQLDIIKIPVYTIFSAVVHKFCDQDIPKYASGLLAKILEICTTSTLMRQINVKNIDILHKMMCLSYEGIRNNRFTFDEEDLRRHGLNFVDVSDLMRKIPKDNFHPGILMEGDIVLSFCHEDLLEFLAACYISKLRVGDFNSFTDDNMKGGYFDHWKVVIQYLCGITLNSQIEFNKKLHEVTDKTKKQEILLDALHERIQDHASAADCLVLHESNDDSLIRQLERISVTGTPLNFISARTISSLMRRKESMKKIWLDECGITDDFLRIMHDNMKGSLLRVEKLKLWESEWDVSCATLNSFLSNFKVEEFQMDAFPIDYHEKFPNFQNTVTLKVGRDIIVKNERHQVLFRHDKDGVSGEFNKNEKLLRLDIKNRDLFYAIRVGNTCAANKVHVSGKQKCLTELKDLHAMLDLKWEVDGKDMDLVVKINESGRDAWLVKYRVDCQNLVNGCSDVREASSRWSVNSLNVEFTVKTQEFLQKFKDEIKVAKISHLTLIASNSYVFCDDDFKIASSITAQCQVQHLELREMENLKSDHLKSILENGQLSILQCSRDRIREEPYFFPLHEFKEIEEAAVLAHATLQGIRQSRSSEKDDTNPMLEKTSTTFADSVISSSVSSTVDKGPQMATFQHGSSVSSTSAPSELVYSIPGEVGTKRSKLSESIENQDLIWLSDGKIAFYKRQSLSKTTQTVFRGWQQFSSEYPEEGREVAIKVIKCEYETNLTNLNELKFLKELNHSNIVQLYDAGEYREGLSDDIYIVMELCSETLTTYVKKKPFDFQKSFSFVNQILEGLDYLHKNNVIHRDLKPDNILFSQDKKNVKLADFGLSRKIRMDRSSVTVTKAGVGTEGYRAPETYEKDYCICSCKTDIFPFGLVTHFIFTKGKHPYGTNPHEWSFNIMKNQNRDFGQFPLFKESYANKKRQLIELLEKTLEYEPDARPTTKEIKKLAFITDHYGRSASQIRTSPHERHHKKPSSSASDLVTQAPISGAGDLSLTSLPVSSVANFPLAIDSAARSGGTVNINYQDNRRIVAETINEGQMTANYHGHTTSITAKQTSSQVEDRQS